MRIVVRWVVAVIVVVHGLIHLLGAAKGLGWADVARLSQPIGTAQGSVGSPPPCSSSSPGG